MSASSHVWFEEFESDGNPLVTGIEKTVMDVAFSRVEQRDKNPLLLSRFHSGDEIAIASNEEYMIDNPFARQSGDIDPQRHIDTLLLVERSCGWPLFVIDLLETSKPHLESRNPVER